MLLSSIIIAQNPEPVPFYFDDIWREICYLRPNLKFHSKKLKLSGLLLFRVRCEEIAVMLAGYQYTEVSLTDTRVVMHWAQTWKQEQSQGS